jgi:hypothetical protein
MALKNNMRIVVLDADIAAPNGSGFIDPLDIRPKQVNWDVTTNAIPATAKDGDNLKVTVGGTYNGVAYAVNDAAYVINKLAGLVAPQKQTVAEGGGGGGVAISGAVWVKSVVKGPASVPGTMLTIGQQTVGNYGIKQLVGDETSLTLTIGALPGAVHTSDTGVTVYAVGGAFTPTALVPYPVGTPANATFASVDGGDSDLDNLQFTANLTVDFGLFDEAQIVVLHSGGAYNLIRYVKQALPLLQEFDITSTYLLNQPAGAMVYDRTAFTSGDTVNFSFAAGGVISEIAIWPFDTVYNSLFGPSGTPLIVPVTGSMVLGQFVGTGSFVIPAPIATNPALQYAGNKKLRVAAHSSGQFSASIECTTAFDFSNRPPNINLDYYARVIYNAFLVTIKDTEEALILSPTPGFGTNITGMVADFSSGYLEQTLPAGVSYYDKRIHSGDWKIRRGPTGYNGLVTTTVTAYNFENGITDTAVFRINVQDTTFPQPVFTANNGNPIRTTITPKVVDVDITSEVCMQSNGGSALNMSSYTTPQATHPAGSVPKTDVLGYLFETTMTVLDSAVRGTYSVADVGLATNAGVATDFAPNSYTISGFEERILMFAAAGSPNVNLAQTNVHISPNSSACTSDYPAGLIVRDVAGTTTFVNGVDYIYNAGQNRIEFQNTPLAAAYYQANTGSLFVRVSQTSAP